ncbi:MAG TPA: SGNH/GDSL hydrolase family protein [Humibacillus xanthopallidus]|nr:SGNH/GDSL hydrolase family protein [Humibacillus xanthopallidus]
MTGSASDTTSATSHPSETAATSGTATPTGPWSIVALGDSVPAGNACGCTPYPELTGQDLAASPDRKVTVTNDAVSGYTTTDVLAQLQTDATVSDKVRSADIVEIEIGANDVGYSDSCGDAVSCYAPTVPEVEKNLGAIVSLVRQLTVGHQALIVLLDYWSVWLGGQYAAAQGEAYVASAAEVTDQVNTVIASTADRTGSAYVDLRAAFKGPDYGYDETHYLAPDGDHPNATGHQQIASATVAVIRSALHLDPTGKG